MKPPRKPTRGRNWQYELAPHTSLLRNIGSVDPQYDGWWLNVGERRQRITGARALRLLMRFRRQRQEAV